MKIKTNSFLFLLFICFAFNSCKKSTLIGNDLLPNSDDLNGIYTDTLTLFSKTVAEFPLKTTTNSKFLLGCVNDPVFGKSSASIFTQFQIGGQVDLGSPDSLFIDSLVLTMQYSGHYGSFTDFQNIKVYQLTQDLNADSAYYSNRSFSCYSNEVGRKLNFTPDFSSTMIIVNDTIPASLRIRLSDHLGQDLLRQSKGANFASNSAFQNYFKGLLIESDSMQNGKGVMYFNLTSSISASKLTVYYHKPDVSALAFDFVIGTDCATFNHYTHDYVSTDIQSAFQSNLTSDSVVYVQSMAGVKTKITIPNLKNLGKILVNKAELEITVPSWQIDPDSVFQCPARMLCLLADSNGKNLVIPDQISSHLVYGGYRETVYLDGEKIFKYKFSITEHMQDLVNGGVVDYGLFLLTYPSPEIADRIILAGGNNNESIRMKINLIYTKLP